MHEKLGTGSVEEIGEDCVKNNFLEIETRVNAKLEFLETNSCLLNQRDHNSVLSLVADRILCSRFRRMTVVYL